MSEAEHREIGEYLSTCGVDDVIAYGTYAANILEGTGNLTAGFHVKTHQEAAELLIEKAQPNDLVLVKGSRGSRMEQVIKGLLEE
jgi:UDP-N-acetylmuramoyl-tripeptide--D-alanyl-D-alanine ligase